MVNNSITNKCGTCLRRFWEIHLVPTGQQTDDESSVGRINEPRGELTPARTSRPTKKTMLRGWTNVSVPRQGGDLRQNPLSCLCLIIVATVPPFIVMRRVLQLSV